MVIIQSQLFVGNTYFFVDIKMLFISTVNNPAILLSLVQF